MRLVTRVIPDWPKLAWVAVFADGSDCLRVFHGSCVETTDKWCVEAVWDGPFDNGDFDRTDLVFGTGIRIREDKATFVTAGTALDRLWHHHSGGVWYISNSLPAILTLAKLDLIKEHNYPRDLGTIIRGLNKYVRSIPTSGGDLHVTYFHNLLYDGENLKEIHKPNTAPLYETFQDYYGFLVQAAERISVNYGSPSRQHRITPVATISRGYDSPMAAVIAKHAGCERAVTIKRARRSKPSGKTMMTKSSRGTLLPHSDCGETIAKYLGLACQSYDRVMKNYPYEEAIWACMGNPGDINLTVFDYPGPLCLLFTGFHGGKVWDRVHHDLSEPFRRGDTSGVRFSEYRLIQGIFHCSVGFWGIQNVQSIQAITTSDEMAPWTLNNNYDRPIPRRIVEQAGVPRKAFGSYKSISSYDFAVPRPLSSYLWEDFKEYCRAQGYRNLSDWEIRLSKLLYVLDRTVFRKSILSKKINAYARWIKFPPRWVFFHWANERMKRMYEKGFRDVASINGTEKSE